MGDVFMSWKIAGRTAAMTISSNIYMNVFSSAK